jgi:hypothetical protein
MLEDYIKLLQYKSQLSFLHSQVEDTYQSLLSKLQSDEEKLFFYLDL